MVRSLASKSRPARAGARSFRRRWGGRSSCALVAAALLLAGQRPGHGAEKEPLRPRPSLAASAEVSGMTVVVRDDRLVVDSVRPGSPAAAAGLLPGDAILVVDDLSLIELDAISPRMALTIFEKSDSGEVRLIVGRGAGTLGIHLPIRAADPSRTESALPSLPTKAGDAAPPFVARDIKKEEVSLQALIGRPVLIDFWASWCLPCRDQAIPLRRIAGEYGDRLAIIGVSLDEDPKAFEAFVYNHRLPGRQVRDGGRAGPISRLYGVTGIPYSILVDPSGRIAAVGNTLQDLERAIARMVDKHGP